MTDLETWIHDYGDRVYRYWVYKRMFTPAEIEGKYTDQSCYESDVCSFGTIKEAVELPNGDVLIGFVDPANNGTSVDGCITYYKLSQIDLMYFPDDDRRAREEDWEELYV